MLNSDSPTLPTALLVETAEVLAQPGERAVLGPSNDGGYYLLGLKTAHQRMFEDIAWSTERVAEQTLERAREIKLEIHMLPVWYDVDDADGLRRLSVELRRQRGVSDGAGFACAEFPSCHCGAVPQQVAGRRTFTTPRGTNTSLSVFTFIEILNPRENYGHVGTRKNGDRSSALL